MTAFWSDCESAWVAADAAWQPVDSHVAVRELTLTATPGGIVLPAVTHTTASPDNGTFEIHPSTASGRSKTAAFCDVPPHMAALTIAGVTTQDCATSLNAARIGLLAGTYFPKPSVVIAAHATPGGTWAILAGTVHCNANAVLQTPLLPVASWNVRGVGKAGITLAPRLVLVAPHKITPLAETLGKVESARAGLLVGSIATPSPSPTPLCFSTPFSKQLDMPCDLPEPCHLQAPLAITRTLLTGIASRILCHTPTQTSLRWVAPLKRTS